MPRFSLVKENLSMIKNVDAAIFFHFSFESEKCNEAQQEIQVLIKKLPKMENFQKVKKLLNGAKSFCQMVISFNVWCLKVILSF
jgi:hypothetical protein